MPLRIVMSLLTSSRCRSQAKLEHGHGIISSCELRLPVIHSSGFPVFPFPNSRQTEWNLWYLETLFKATRENRSTGMKFDPLTRKLMQLAGMGAIVTASFGIITQRKVKSKSPDSPRIGLPFSCSSCVSWGTTEQQRWCSSDCRDFRG